MRPKQTHLVLVTEPDSDHPPASQACGTKEVNANILPNRKDLGGAPNEREGIHPILDAVVIGIIGTLVFIVTVDERYAS